MGIGGWSGGEVDPANSWMFNPTSSNSRKRDDIEQEKRCCFFRISPAHDSRSINPVISTAVRHRAGLRTADFHITRPAIYNLFDTENYLVLIQRTSTMAQFVESPTLISGEPSQPVIREKENLPPKSYADAADHAPDKVNGIENIPPAQFIGKGEVETQRTPPFSQTRHRKSGSLRVNGASKQPKASNLPVEDIQDRDGEQLSTTKLTFTDQPKPQKPQPELVSGRRAGARWERSQFVKILSEHTPQSYSLI